LHRENPRKTALAGCEMRATRRRQSIPVILAAQQAQVKEVFTRGADGSNDDRDRGANDDGPTGNRNCHRIRYDWCARAALVIFRKS